MIEKGMIVAIDPDAIVPDDVKHLHGLRGVVERVDEKVQRPVVVSFPGFAQWYDFREDELMQVALDKLRDAGLDFVVLDETIFMMPGVFPEVIHPMLRERKGGTLFISTPYDRNWFWEIYQLGLDSAQTKWRPFHYPFYSAKE